MSSSQDLVLVCGDQGHARKFRILKSRLIQHSGYFGVMFQDDSKVLLSSTAHQIITDDLQETQTGKVVLREDDLQALNSLLSALIYQSGHPEVHLRREILERLPGICWNKSAQDNPKHPQAQTNSSANDDKLIKLTTLLKNFCIMADKYDMQWLHQFVTGITPSIWSHLWNHGCGTSNCCEASTFIKSYYEQFDSITSGYPQDLWDFFVNALVHYQRFEPQSVHLLFEKLDKTPDMMKVAIRASVEKLAAEKNKAQGGEQKGKAKANDTVPLDDYHLRKLKDSKLDG